MYRRQLQRYSMHLLMFNELESYPACNQRDFWALLGRQRCRRLSWFNISSFSFYWSGKARDSYKQIRVYEKIGDIKGANIARAQIVENGFIFGASVALAIVRIFGAVQELFELFEKSDCAFIRDDGS